MARIPGNRTFCFNSPLCFHWGTRWLLNSECIKHLTREKTVELTIILSVIEECWKYTIFVAKERFSLLLIIFREEINKSRNSAVMVIDFRYCMWTKICKVIKRMNCFFELNVKIIKSTIVQLHSSRASKLKWKRRPRLEIHCLQLGLNQSSTCFMYIRAAVSFKPFLSLLHSMA